MFVLHKPRISRNFDSRKDFHSAKFERKTQILVKLSFKDLRGPEVSSICLFDNMTISMT